MSRGVGLTPEKVIDAAQALANADGLHALSLTQLAAACGVRKPSLYKHIDGLPGVHRALALRAYRRMSESLSTVPRDADLLTLAIQWRAFAHAEPGLYAALTRSHIHLDESARAEAEAVLQQALPRFGEGAEAVHRARALRALIYGFVMLEAADGFGLDVDVDASFAWAVRSLMT